LTVGIEKRAHLLDTRQALFAVDPPPGVDEVRGQLCPVTEIS
jgi:hypothetical protein